MGMKVNLFNARRELYKHGIPAKLVRPSACRMVTTSELRFRPLLDADLKQFPPERIRNFAIIAHIDHGKSTLADRMLEFTRTIPSSEVIQGGASLNQQVLDRLKVERERGITVKAAAATMAYCPPGETHPYLLNLLDTPGHVDFASEVHRSLLACQGAILLVDASQGIQAQTLTVFEAARSQAGLEIVIGVLNKIDLPHANVPSVTQQVETLLGESGGEGGPIICVSAKEGKGVENVLDRIIKVIPPPTGQADRPLRALVFDNYFDPFRGVVSLIAVVDGHIEQGDGIAFQSIDRRTFEVTGVGILHPDEVPSSSGIRAGQVGWMTCNMKDEEDANLGDTIYTPRSPVEPLTSFKPLQPMVFAGFYPINAADFPALDDAIQRLILTDRSITCARESSAALGQGFRLGFLGSLHMDVIRQRLADEYAAEVVVTRAFVPIQITRKDGTIQMIDNPVDFPETAEFSGGSRNRVVLVSEPVVDARIVVPDEYAGSIMELCAASRGEHICMTYLDADATSSSPRVMLTYALPLAAIISEFHSNLKSLSSGFASLDYTTPRYAPADLVKLSILVDGHGVDALCTVVHRDAAEKDGRTTLARLKDVVPRQQYEVALQAAIGSKIIARERIQAFRKDVLVKVTGADRKRKKLEEQKEGKKRMRSIGGVRVPAESLYGILSAKDTTSSPKRKS